MSEIDFKYSHAAILVTNIERSKPFYEQAVGWKQLFTAEFDEKLGEANGYGGRGKIAMGDMGGVHLQLVEMQVPLERRAFHKHCGLFLCSVMVKPKDVPAVRARLEAANIPITRELDVGRSHLLIMTDPDGQEIGIVVVPEQAS
jgi:catechol 2,3-dioxygenase-like lactoylglutathione lyase family enzyme